ncbi:MAG: tetratricopeptide repeat protein [Nitrospiria bacterium]
MNNLFLLLFFSLTSCAAIHTPSSSPLTENSMSHIPEAEKENPFPETKSKSLPDRIAEPDAYYHYILGNLYELENNIPRAYFEYKSALILDPRSTTLKYEIATLAVRAGDLKSAEQYLQSLLEIAPDHAEGLGLLGDIYANQDKINQAITAYQKLFILNPDLNEAYIEVASLFLKEKKVSEAEKTISNLINRKPGSPIGYYYLGRILFEEQKYKESIERYNDALKRDNSYEPAWMGIGMVYETEGESGKALQNYRKYLETAGADHREPRYRIIHLLFQEKAYSEAKRELEDLLKLDPNDIEGNFRLALLFADQKDYSRAIQLLNVAIQRRGNDPRLVDYLGSLYEANNENEKAIQAYLTVIEVDKTYTDSYIHLASVYLKLKKIDSAIKTLEEARMANPQKEDILLSGEGWIYLQVDRFEESLEAFRHAIQISPNNPDFHYNLGQAFDKMNKFDEMEKEMRKTIELEPNYADALNYLGYSYAEKNIKLKEAYDLITRALKVRPNDGFITDSLAWVYYRQGEFDKAISELKKALVSVPDDPTIHEHLGEVYYKMNIKQEAKEEFLKSIEINPANQKLIARFKEYGLNDQKSEERIQKALKKVEPPFPSSNKTNQADSGNSKI